MRSLQYSTHTSTKQITITRFFVGWLSSATRSDMPTESRSHSLTCPVASC